MQILEQVAISNTKFFLASRDKLIFKGYTHIFTLEGLLTQDQIKRYRYILMNPSSIQKSTDAIKVIPKILDFIREVYVLKGKVLFIENTESKELIYTHSIFLRECILYLLASLFKCSVYDMWMLINNQTLYFHIPMESIRKLSSAIAFSQRILSLGQELVNLQCYCGCNTLVITNEAIDKKDAFPCDCSRSKQTNLVADCPSDGCFEYIKFVNKKYNLSWSKIRWKYFKPSEFILGPLYAGQISNKFYVKNLLCSEGPVENSIVYSKKASQDSQFYKNNDEDYRIVCCKICQMWVYGINTKEDKIAVPINNRVTKRKSGLLQFKFKGGNVSIKAPVLRKINLGDIYN